MHPADSAGVPKVLLGNRLVPTRVRTGALKRVCWSGQGEGGPQLPKLDASYWTVYSIPDTLKQKSPPPASC